LQRPARGKIGKARADQLFKDAKVNSVKPLEVETGFPDPMWAKAG
jgi:hypothetical protein